MKKGYHQADLSLASSDLKIELINSSIMASSSLYKNVKKNCWCHCLFEVCHTFNVCDGLIEN